MEKYTHGDMGEVLSKLTKNELIDLMFQALDLMQQYNGRNKTWCVCDVLFGPCKEIGGEEIWKSRTIGEIKRILC